MKYEAKSLEDIAVEFERLARLAGEHGLQPHLTKAEVRDFLCQGTTYRHCAAIVRATEIKP